MERRAAVRYVCGLQTGCRVLDTAEVGDWRAWVRDISTSGISLLIERRFQPDTILIIELENKQQNFLERLLAKVVHTVIQYPNDAWLHGCAFVKPLSEEQVKSLI